MEIKKKMSMVEAASDKIQVRDLNFYYGKFHALKNINLDIAKIQVTAFIGPSGCGKSTLLRTFNKMYSLYPEQRAEGEILLDGENILTQNQDIAHANRLTRAKVDQWTADVPGFVFCHQQHFKTITADSRTRQMLHQHDLWPLRDQLP